MNRRQALVDQLLKVKSADSAAQVPKAEFDIPATRNGFLALVYEQGWIAADSFSAHCSDKLLLSDLIKAVSKEAYERFHPLTFGVREYLESSKAASAPLDSNFVIKAVDGMNTDGKGLFRSWEEFLSVWSDPGEQASGLTGLLSSGESHMVQAVVGNPEHELRLHTWEGDVIPGATFTRWDQPWSLQWFAEAEQALQEFLNLLPRWFVARQAWSIDLMGRDGVFRLVELNSNRGLRKHWSGDLSLPDTLQAYVLYLESRYGLTCAGQAGALLRAGEANQEAYLRKFGLSAARRHRELKKSLKTNT
jgi:hypothetical protein